MDLILSKVDLLANMASSREDYCDNDDSDNESMSGRAKVSSIRSNRSSKIVQEKLEELKSSTAFLASHTSLTRLEPAMTTESSRSLASNEPNTLATSSPDKQKLPSGQVELHEVISEIHEPTETDNSELASERPYQLELPFSSPDFSSLLFANFSELNSNHTDHSKGDKSRRNTITSPNPCLKTRPSKTDPFLFERIKSVRRTGNNANGYVPPAQGLIPSLTATPITNSESPSLAGKGSDFASSESLGKNHSPRTDVQYCHSNDSKRLEGKKSSIEATTNESDNIKDQNRNEEKPILVNGPTVESPVISLNSFDAHIASQLYSIPTPLLNAISFTPPIGGAVVVSSSDNDEDLSDVDSIFTQVTHISDTEAADATDATDDTDATNAAQTQELAKAPAEIAVVDPEDRGRLFVRVDGLSQLTLPFVSHQNPKFTMTLDNGLQSVTIEPVPIKSTNPGISQEFELIVGSDLQFILTFQAQRDQVSEPKIKQDEPAETKVEPEEPSVLATPPASPKKQSRFRTMFSSPKKKASTLLQSSSSTANIISPGLQQEQPQSKPKDMWEGLVGPTGEFGRCYLQASTYESKVYGCCKTFNLNVYNEWAYKEEEVEVSAGPAFVTIPPSLSSMVPSGTESAGKNLQARKSGKKRVQSRNISGSIQRNVKLFKKGKKKIPIDPFKISTVQITMMYIPNPPTLRGHPAPSLPTSMNSALKEFNQMKANRNIKLDGYLSQEGGDCNYWRRRWFELRGDTLVGHTEDTKKVRTILHLANVHSVLDIANLNDTITDSVERAEMYGGSWYMYADRSFRIRFMDGEIVDFYADNAQKKDEWVRALTTAVKYCTDKSYTWVDMVLEHNQILEETRENTS